ncbi:NAD(P)H-dependent oxidoreductase [Rhizobium sp. BC49]|nr:MULTISPECIES: NAD(P)H-dependent oxidoreductase [unclassified Rhizobium]MDF0664181.1 NAD(P)H-dependent oxidoreductase [Rhizobium sp. BC49]
MNILHIDRSPRQQSHSRQLSAAIVEKLLEVAPGADIIRRDLGADPLPQTVALYAAALASPATLAAPPAGSLDLSEQLIREVEAADAVVIGTPMHNLTIPSVLKAWIDQVLRVGRTMKSTPTGKVGMFRDRPVFIGVASGGFFTGERAKQPLAVAELDRPEDATILSAELCRHASGRTSQPFRPGGHIGVFKCVKQHYPFRRSATG